MNTYDFSDLHRPVSLQECFEQAGGHGLKLTLWSLLPLVIAFIALSKWTGQVVGVLLFICTLVAGIAVVTRWQVAKTRVRLSHFAQRNGMAYQAIAPYDGQEGAIFTSNRPSYFQDLLRITNETPFPIEIGTYHAQYSTRSAKTRMYGVICITLPRPFSQMVLDAHSNNMMNSKYVSNLPQVYEASQKVSINTHYDEYFTLYADTRFMNEIHQLFTPELLQVIMSAPQGRFYDYEVIDDRFYVYTGIGQYFALSNEERLRAVLEFSTRLAACLRLQITGQRTDRPGDTRPHPAETAPPLPAERLRIKVPVVRILLTIVAVVAGWYLVYTMREAHPWLSGLF